MFRTGYFLDDQAPEQDDWNAAFRWTARDLAWFMAYLLFGDSAATGDAVVVDGLECTAGSGMQTDYTAGAALHYDASVYTATLKGNETASPFGVQMVTAAGSITHSANSSGSTRVDIITISGALGTDTPENVQQDGGSTTSQDTRWGTEATVTKTEGTPGAGVPATPTGHTKVAEVSIPNGAASAAAFTYTDTRYYARKPWKVGSTGTGTVDMARAYRDDSEDELAHQWDSSEHWPIVERISPPTGDTSSDLYLMACPGSRTWWRTVPLDNLTLGVGHAASNYTATVKGWDPLGDWVGTEFNITGTGDDDDWYQTFPSEQRALTVVGGRVHFDVDTAVGVGTTIDATLYHYDASAGTTTAISDTTTLVTSATSTGTSSTALTNVTETGVDVDDLVFIVFEIANPSNSGGNVDMRTASVQYKEGRA